jgi:hypothetical protein
MSGVEGPQTKRKVASRKNGSGVRAVVVPEEPAAKLSPRIPEARRRCDFWRTIGITRRPRNMISQQCRINSTIVFFEMHFEFARGLRMLVIKLIHLEGLLLVPLSETRSIRIYGRAPASVLSTGQQRCAISS